MNKIIERIINEKNEDVIEVLGKEYLNSANDKSAVILTSNYIYFSGLHYRYDKGNIIQKTANTESFDLKDCLRVEYMNKRPRRTLYILVTSGIALNICMQILKYRFFVNASILEGIIVALTIFSLICFLIYAIRRYRFLEITFIGARICVPEKDYSKADMQKFIDAVYRAK